MITKSILHECHKEGFNNAELYGAYKIFFGTLVSEPRLKIINFLRKGRMNVSELIEALKMDQTSVSHDLKRLRDCGFVIAQREGKFVYYSLNAASIKPLMELIEKHMGDYCVHILRSMKENKI